VVTAGTGVEEVVVRDQTARVVTPGDLAAFVRAVRGLLDDDQTRRAMGQAARQRAVQRAWSKTFTSLQRTYRTLAADPPLGD